ncbi:alpha/beta hydrolase [Clostridium sp. C8-1-8]|uniref:alpha/beta hydrolase family protein n=1 Tax=Clostridium sp. C8-1-8 TaxID=2698831 RepID=UPI001FAE3E3E|nr:alpha/beta hydrolase [Clostridium sp. C8-1-8]
MAFLCYLQDPGTLTKKQYHYNTTVIKVKNSGQTIRGTLYVPDDKKKTREILIMSHGFNCQSALLANKAKSLAESGIATLIFDFRGGSFRGQSDGVTESMTYLTEVSDLECIMKEVKNYEWVDQSKIYLMGESFGGLVSALTAAQHSDVAGLILCFPAFSSADSARINFSSIEAIPKTFAVGKMTTGSDFWKTLYNLDVYKEIGKYEGNVIIMHGTEDQNVDPKYSIKANNIYKNSELFLLEGAGHGFGGNDAKSSLKTIYSFITKKDK